MKKLILLVALIPSILFAGPDPRGILELEGYGNSDAVGITAKRGRNDFTIKEPLASADVLFFIRGYGYNGSAFGTNAAAAIEATAGQAWTTTANGTRILFKTTPAGSTTPATVGTFQPDGGFLPYSRTEAQLKVSTPSAVGAIYYDSTNKEFVQSTGTTTCFDYAKIEDATAAPDGW